MGILSGIRVLDCSIAMAGPFAAQRLGDLGADVVKVEPVTGEWQRHVAAGGARGNKVNVSFLSLNRNKRSLAVDLKAPEGKEILYDLVKTADVFLQNYRPGVAKRLGVDYETLSKLNPRLVYVSMSGYGESGPYVNRPGQDLVLQAMSGAMLSAGRAGEAPTPAGQYLVDAITAYTAFEGALAALFHRERTGEGQLVAGQHARCHRDDPDAGAVGLHRRRQGAEAIGRAACPCLHPRALWRVCDQRRLHRRRLSVAEEARRGDRRGQLPRHGRRGRHLDAAATRFSQRPGSA